ncbi:hypothetical protein AB0M43_06040 [Longispora sp. NPDC051575]|uniref:hypothetical protein n=1 Tax=Longispora sp. NPDC051575 TaxID=3154943 RepID=UPI00343D19A5
MLQATTNWQYSALRGGITVRVGAVAMHAGNAAVHTGKAVTHMSNRPLGHLHPKPYLETGRWQA